VISFVIQHHAHRTLAHLRRKLVRCLAHNRPFLSGAGASGNPGAVQTSFKDCWFKNADFRNADNILEADFTGAKGLEDAFFDNDEIRAAVLAQATGGTAA
jgi:hypothetical protein